MQKEYTINLIRPTYDSEEDHEREEKNLIRINVFNKNGKVINDELYSVQIEFSKDGALGFGKELIRAAFNNSIQSGYHHHLTPISKDKAVLNMGVCVTHDSPELIIAFQELGNIIEEKKKAKEML